MEVQFGQNAHDEPNLLYKLQRKIKVFDTSDPLPNRGYNLVASASKYGAIFVGTTDKELLVYRLNELVDKECEPSHLPVPLQEKPTHIAVNSDQELLAVTGGRLFVLFKVVDLLNQNVSPSMSVQFDVSPSTFVSDVKWNPCIPDTIAYAFYDGAIVICQAGQGQVKKLQSSARCICWSPKGKQLVVGNNDGTICQYKPDLSLMKSFPAPNLFQNAPVEVLAIHWISTFQFAAVYRNAMDNSKPAVTIVNTPKGGQPSCLSFEDACYSMGSSRPWYYYLQGFAQWNVILCSSSNSMEIATLGTADGTSWLPWSQPDEARPELPLTDKKQENYPIGIAIDTAAVHQLPWGENEKLPFMPTLHVLSQTGLLTIFNFINLSREAAQICTPVTVVSNTPFPAQRQPEAPPAAAPQPKPVQASPPAVSAPAGLFAAAVANAHTLGAGVQHQQPSFQQQQQQALQQQHQQPPHQHQQPVAQPVKPPEAQAPVPTAQAQPKPAPIPQKDHTQELNAALKAEQELANKQKADQEFRGMLVSEVNEFQAELYDFVVKTRKAQIQFYRELHAIDTNAELQNIDGATIKKECSLEDLRSAIIALKLDLVRTCAVVAEARTHSDAKELDQWTQADPLTTKRVASVKKLAYYVQTQLEQAHSSLNYKWNQLVEHDLKSNKPGSRMTRPIMDDVYQPLVRQQEILSRQAAVLKVLKSTLNECDGPVYKSTPILRSTPFKNNPLSKLTKNLLNMSLEPQTSDNKNLLTPQKLDALRDMLSNHKTVKIKPVNVEMRDYLTTMRKSYENNMKEKAKEQFILKVEPVTVKVQVKQEVKRQVKPPQQPPAPLFTPIVVKPAAPPVTKTWFTEVPEPPSPQTDAKQDISFTISSIPNASYNPLKDVTVEVKKDDNNMDSFMGQKICSPSNFNFSSVIVATPTSFTTKPISALNNMLNQFAPRTVPDNKSTETGEPVSNVKEENQMSNLFKISTSTPKPTQNIPDVLGNSNVITFKRMEPKAEPKPEKAGEKSKENVPGKSDNVILSIPKPNKEEKKVNEPFSVQKTNKPLFGSIAQPVAISSAFQSGDAQKSVEVKAKLKTEGQKEESKVNEPKPFSVQNTNKPLFGSVSQPVAISSAFQSGDAQKSVEVKAKLETEAQKEGNKVNEHKPFSVQNTNKPLFGSVSQPVAISSAFQSGDAQKSVEVKAKLETEAPKEAQKSETAPASSVSIFATANATITIPKPKSMFGSAVASTTSAVPFQSISVSKPDSSSIFASANSTAPKTQPSSIFAANSSTPSTVFANSKPSIFGMATPTPSPVTATPSASTVKSVERTSDTAVSTPSSVFGSISKFGSSAFTAPTTAAVSVSFSAPTTKSALESAISTPSSTIASTPTTTSQSVFSAATTQSGTVSSIFGSVTSTTQPSVFGGTVTSTTSVFGTASSTSTSVFGSTTSTTKSAFGTSTATPVPVTFASPPTTKTPLPGSSANTQASIFGGTTTTQSSVFGSTTTPTSVFVSATTTQSSVFESTATTSASVFGSTTAATPAFGTTATTETPALGTTATTQASIFGSNTTTSASVFGSTASTPASVFGSVAASQSPAFGSPPSSPAPAFGAATTQASVFGTPSTQASVFGSAGANQTSVFGSPATTQASVFGSAPTTQASIFGSPVASPAFGSPAATQSSVFGSGETAQPSVFGSPPTTQASIFGSPPTTQASGFGSPPTTQASVFGSPPTTQASVFGSPPTTQASVFGTPASPGFGATSQASVFGTPASPTSVFGTPTQSTQASVFGTPTETTQSSVFGTPTQTTQSSVFGTPATTAQASVFGSPSQSVFGAPATTAQGSIFGGGDSLFASVSISTTSASSSSAGSIFGGGSTATSGFGNSNTNVFGGKSTFGQPNPATEALFGGGGAGAGFGQTAPANNFWGSNNNSSGGFGSGFGQQPTTQASSVFGTGSFSAPSPPGQAFGSPTSSPGGFGSGFGSKAAFGQSTGFGSPTSSGFGAPAAFSGFSKSPGAFGGSASFGGAPAFGAPSAFGSTSPGAVFGGAAPAAGFGAPTQSNAMFESLATQNTLSFGNLAQQTTQPAQTAPSFNTSPSFTSWRG